MTSQQANVANYYRLLYKYNILYRGHVSDALPSLLIIIYPYKINRNHADMW